MASSTFSPKNSSIYLWLDYDPGNQYRDYGEQAMFPLLPLCQNGTTKVNCAKVCNDSASLFASFSTQSTNLVTCGLWTTHVMAYSEFRSNGTISPSNVTVAQKLSSSYGAIGLSAKAFPDAFLYADRISSCFHSIYSNIKPISYFDEGHAPLACTRENLFAFNELNIQPLRDCIQAICSPLTLNSDLAGIGVFSSFIVQSALTVILFAALLYFESRTPAVARPRRITTGSHAGRVLKALANFHKAQCYFSMVIQITALALYRKSMRAAATNSEDTYGIMNDFLDMSILVVLATGGLIPISLTLTCLTRYGQESWYMLMISSVTVILWGATLIASYHWAEFNSGMDEYFDRPMQYKFSNLNSYMGSTSCTLGNANFSDIVFPLFGNSKLLSNTLPYHAIDNWWIWLILANCIVWTLLCLGRKCCDRSGPFRLSIRHTRIKDAWERFVVDRKNGLRTWIFASTIPWSLCFAWQFYLFGAFFEHKVISSAKELPLLDDSTRLK